MFDIMKGIPMPNAYPANEPKNPVRYTVGKLKVGDCFFVPVNGLRERMNTTANAHNAANANGMKVSVRTVSGSPKEILGIWRIK